MTLSNSCSSVKVGMDLSEPFDTVRGFRQGDPLSCDLFNFVMESVLRKAGVHRSGTIFQKSDTVKEFIYLGSAVTTKNDVSLDAGSLLPTGASL